MKIDFDKLEFVHDISIEKYNGLRESVDFITIIEKRAQCALEHSLYKVIATYEGEPIGMARVVGDGGYVYFICDVIVNPNYQSMGIGRKLIENVLGWLENQVDSGETIMVNLMSAMNKEAFYERLGFNRRPFGNHGCGMSKWISKEE